LVEPNLLGGVEVGKVSMFHRDVKICLITHWGLVIFGIILDLEHLHIGQLTHQPIFAA